jgi:HAE1 family hydrophobic/amphiphilic exporter-1
VWLTRISIKNPYFATVIMFAILLMGIISLNRISVEEFPSIKFPFVVVTTNYKGASPEVVETDITKPLEEAVYSINGIKEVRSYSFEGSSTVVAEFNLNIDPDTALQDTRDKVSTAAANFRKEIDIPTVSKVNIQDNPIMTIAIGSNSVPLREISDWVNQIAKKKLQTISGVGDVKLVGGVSRQVRINLEPYKLQSLGISANDVISAIKNANDNYPAGDIKTKDKNINVRLNGKLKTPQDFANIVVTYRNDVPIKISDIASVSDGQDEYTSMSIVNGNKAVGLEIRQTSNANVVDIAQDVYVALAELNKIKPFGTEISVTYDQSKSVKSSLDNIESTLFEGALLTIAIVFMFLKSWRSTVITGLTLPIALLGTIFAIYICGFTLNMMSLLALSLSIGLLIDDAIVVRENIVRHLHMGKSHIQAALEGTKEIGLAVLSTTLTLVAVFLPVGLMEGIIGKFFFQFGITVTVSVLISLFVSFTLDPMLSSIWHEPADGGWLAKSKIGKILDKFEDGFLKIASWYESFIRVSLKFKKSTLLVSFGLLIGGFMLVPLIGGEFMPRVDKGQYMIKFKTDVGANISYTYDKTLQINKILLKQIPQIKSVSIVIGGGWGDGANNASLTIDIGRKKFRNVSLVDVMTKSRNLLNNIGGVKIVSIAPLGSPGGDNTPINVNIKGDSMQILNKISEELMLKISKIKGVTDLSTSFDKGNPSFNIEVNREIASDLGVNLSDVGGTLSTLFAGNKVSTWEDPENGQNYDVVVQVPEGSRDFGVLDLLKVPSNKVISNGFPEMVSLSAIASVKPGYAPRELDHFNLHRKITITGNIEGLDNQKVFSQIQHIIDKYYLPPGYEISQNGDSEDMKKSFFYAVSALMVGVVFIYMILTAQFRSFILPLVIMVALPLSFIGVFIALFLFGTTLNMFSIIGIIMLMGLSTKNGILLVDFINQQIMNGVDQTEAIVEAGTVRLRPIIMTTLAMIFGMLPLALSHGDSSEVRKPMAYAIIGGLTTSTLLTLIVVPVVYVYFDKLGKYIKSKLIK